MLWVRSSMAEVLDRDRSVFARAIECEKSVAHALWPDKKTRETEQPTTHLACQSSLSR